ncbi:MAG: hypothetical protein KAJ51_17920 [Thermoplasmata archaeon]|nr:hypothetical protein [Thermoplasmata archaeon]
MEFWVTQSKKVTDFKQPLSIEDKIQIFEEGTAKWHLHIAELCINGGKDGEGKEIPAIYGSGFAVLKILLSYFEMIAKYEHGFNKIANSTEYFKKGVKSVFPQLKSYEKDIVDNLLTVLYVQGRCGLYHGDLTGTNIILSANINALEFVSDEKILGINPHKLPSILREHLKKYVARLKDANNEPERRNFESHFNWLRDIS